MLIAAPAWSESWERYAKTEEAVLYFDEHRRVVMSGTAFIWDLHDFRNIAIDAAGQSYRSILYATEYNCRKETRRVLSAQRMQDSYGKRRDRVREHASWRMGADCAAFPGSQINDRCLPGMSGVA